MEYIYLLARCVEDTNFFIIYLNPDKLYPIEDRQISCMRHEKFKFAPKTPVASSQGMFGQESSNSDMNRFLAAITTGFENAQDLRNIDMQQYNPTTQQGTPLEVIQRYKTKISRENFYTLTEIALLNNKLTDDGTGAQQDQ